METYFDEVVLPSVLPKTTNVVVHRNAAGDVFAFHSPLDRGPVRCDLCQDPETVVHAFGQHVFKYG